MLIPAASVTTALGCLNFAAPAGPFTRPGSPVPIVESSCPVGARILTWWWSVSVTYTFPLLATATPDASLNRSCAWDDAPTVVTVTSGASDTTVKPSVASDTPLDVSVTEPLTAADGTTTSSRLAD